ncbi:MAG: DMT family transporter [Candidatus Lokiarchaeota archaeon]|nr:DMT family transporter [Candidatus Lokiarchaeota archaeon]
MTTAADQARETGSATRLAEPAHPSPRRRTAIAVSLVLFATVVWGSQYIVIKQGAEMVPPFFFQGMRHVVAFVGFCPWWGRLRKMNRTTFVGALLVATTLFVLIAFLTVGLGLTTSNKGAFMATMYVVFTPFVGFAMLRSRIKPMHLAGVAIAVAGMAIMLFGSTPGGSPEVAFNAGDVLVLIGAFFNAIQIVLLEKYTNKVDTMQFVLTQMWMIAAFSLGTSFLIQEPMGWLTMPAASMGGIWFDWIYLGILASTVTLFIQAWAQKTIDATRAALMYSLEPVFAIFFGVTVGGEPLYWTFVIGALLIMAGIIASSVKVAIRKKGKESGPAPPQAQGA